MLGWAAFVGLAAGAASLLVFDADQAGDTSLVLVRIALVLPAVIYVLWWIAFPRPTLLHPDLEMPREGAEPDALSQRMELIEESFAGADRRRFRRRPPEPAPPAARELLNRSVRRPSQTTAADRAADFGLRRAE